MNDRRFTFSAGDWALLVCAVGWGSTFPLTKLALAHASPIAFNAVRFLFSGLLLLPLISRPGSIPGDRAEGTDVRGSLEALRRALPVGVLLAFLIALGFWLQTWGLTRISAPRSAFLTVFYTLFVAPLEWLVTRRRPGIPVLIGCVVALIGVGLMTGAGIGEPLALGDLATLMAALVFAGQMVALSHALVHHSSRQILFLEVFLCGIFSIPAAYFFDRPFRFTWNAEVLLALAYLGLVATILLLALQNFGQRRTTATRAGLLFATEPVWALLLAWAVSGEVLSGREWVGGGLVLGGVALAAVGPREK